MEKSFETLKKHIVEHPPNLGEGGSVPTMLYECHNENNPYDNEQIRADFNELYQQMNGMPLRDMDQIASCVGIMRGLASLKGFAWVFCLHRR